MCNLLTYSCSHPAPVNSVLLPFSLFLFVYSSSFLVEHRSSTRACRLTLFCAVPFMAFHVRQLLSNPTLPFSYVARCAGVSLLFHYPCGFHSSALLTTVHDLLEKADRTLFEKIRKEKKPPTVYFTTKAALYHPSITVIKYCVHLPLLKTERFKKSFSNRLAFRYYLAI